MPTAGSLLTPACDARSPHPTSGPLHVPLLVSTTEPRRQGRHALPGAPPVRGRSAGGGRGPGSHRVVFGGRRGHTPCHLRAEDLAPSTGFFPQVLEHFLLKSHKMLRKERAGHNCGHVQPSHCQ